MSSKRGVRRKACLGKVRYSSLDEALGGTYRLRHNEGRNGTPMDIYRCKFCGGYHVGHKKHKYYQYLYIDN